MNSHVNVYVSLHVNVHISSHVTFKIYLRQCYPIFVTFIFVIEIGLGLGGFKPIL
jgi:hypothetical protein